MVRMSLRRQLGLLCWNMTCMCQLPIPHQDPTPLCSKGSEVSGGYCGKEEPEETIGPHCPSCWAQSRQGNQVPETEEDSLVKETKERAFLRRPGSSPKTTKVWAEEGSGKKKTGAKGQPPHSMHPTNPSYCIKCKMTFEQCLHSLHSLLYHH